jgi:hypothetical protein
MQVWLSALTTTGLGLRPKRWLRTLAFELGDSRTRTASNSPGPPWSLGTQPALESGGHSPAGCSGHADPRACRSDPSSFLPVTEMRTLAYPDQDLSSWGPSGLSLYFWKCPGCRQDQVCVPLHAGPCGAQHRIQIPLGLEDSGRAGLGS